MDVRDGFLQQLVLDACRDGVQKLVVGAVIADACGRVILLVRSDGEFLPGLVELPSGGVDVGEDLMSALVREVKEETSLEICDVTRYISSFDYVSQSGKKARQFNFAVRTKVGDVQLNPTEHHSFWFVDPRSIDALNISENSKEVIRRYWDES